MWYNHFETGRSKSQRQESRPRMHNFFPSRLVFVILLASIFTAITGCSTQSALNIKTPESTVVKGIRIDIEKTYRQSSLLYPIIGISGLATNESGHALRVLTIEFGAYDQDGVKISSAHATTGSLSEGGKWRFDAMFISTVDRKYQYEEIKLESVNGMRAQ